MKNILCYSAGKDSTAMLIHCIKENIPIDEILYVDMNNWMWKEAKTHNQQVEKTLNVKITNLKVESEELIKGFKRWGFPSFINRWCTGIKREVMKQYLKNKYPDEEIIQFIGYTSDEGKRFGNKLYNYDLYRYPLVEAGITKEDALKLCQEYGFTFGEVYSHHEHFNCWLCPLQKINELRYLYNTGDGGGENPYWRELRRLQSLTDGSYRVDKTIFELEQKFWLENKNKLKNDRMLNRKKYNKRK